jgi:glutaredoxin 3
VKEYLSTRGVEFDAIDVQADPEALDMLAALGVRAIPVIRRGDDVVVGMSLAAVDDFLGIDRSVVEDEPPPQELAKRMSRVMMLAIEYGSLLPPSEHETCIPGRDRTYLGLVAHVVGHVGRFVRLTEAPEDDYSDVAIFEPLGQPPAAATFEELAALARELDTELVSWSASSPDLTVPTRTFFGEQTLGWLMLSTTYSVVQHTRQLRAVLEMLAIEPAREIDPTDLVGLRIPTGIWDEAVPDTGAS